MAEQNAGTCDIGVIGMAVMGQNLALNMESKGPVPLQRTTRVPAFIARAGKQERGGPTSWRICRRPQASRKAMLMVQPGAGTER